MHPSISIIIPVYNKTKYLKTLIEQLTVQTYTNYECLLIDDGSTDGSDKICDDISSYDDRFISIHILNGGVSHARNHGIDRAQGNLITFVDADDELDSRYLETLYSTISEHDCDLVITGYSSIWDNSDRIEEKKLPYQDGIYSLDELLKDFASVQKETGLYGYCWGKIFKRQLLGKIRFDESLHLAEDFDFYLKLYPKTKKIFIDHNHFYYYRQDAENSSVRIDDNKIDYISQLKINIRYKHFLLANNSFNGANSRILSQILSNYIFFSLFHSNLKSLKEDFRFILQTVALEDLEILPTNITQKFVFFCLSRKSITLLKTYLYTYRLLHHTKFMLLKAFSF